MKKKTGFKMKLQHEDVYLLEHLLSDYYQNKERYVGSSLSEKHLANLCNKVDDLEFFAKFNAFVELEVKEKVPVKL